MPKPVAAKAKKFHPPTIEECQAHAVTLTPALPQNEIERFFYYYQANGWRVGKNQMQLWRAALSGWHVRWRQDNAQRETRPDNVQIILRQKELERVEARMKSIRSSYNDHQNWDTKDKNLFQCLKVRKDQLLKILGMTI